MKQVDLTIIDDNDVVTTKCHDLSLFIEQGDLIIIDDLAPDSKLINEVTEEIITDRPTNDNKLIDKTIKAMVKDDAISIIQIELPSDASPNLIASNDVIKVKNDDILKKEAPPEDTTSKKFFDSKQ